MVLTSLNEGTPVSLIEAQAAKNPIISTNVGGSADIMINNETGFLADKGNYIDFVKKIQLLVEDECLRKKMGNKGSLFVEDRFNYLRLISDMKKIYYCKMDANGIN